MLQFTTYNAALLATAQVNLAKRIAGDKGPAEPLPTTATKNVAYQIPDPVKAEYALKVIGSVKV